MFISPRLGNFADRLKPQVGIIIFATLGALVTLIEINVPILLIFSLLLIADNMFANATGLVMSNVFSRISIKDRGKVLGVASAFNNGGGVFGPIIGGILIDAFNPAMPFFVSVFVELALIPLYLLALKRLRPYYEEIVKNAEDTTIIDHDSI
jgi:MFS family permease